MGLTVPVAECLPVAAPSSLRIIHLIAFTTRQAEPVQACWLQWVSQVLARDTSESVHYRLHLRSYQANLSAPAPKVLAAGARAGTFKSAVRRKAPRRGSPRAARGAGDRAARRRLVVTDFDAPPLRPYSALLGCLGHELTFTRRRTPFATTWST